MTELQKTKKKIAILRGGKIIHEDSFSSGGNLILSLSKIEDLQPIDIFIDKNGNWFEKGVPSDAHSSLSTADYYIDTTRDFSADYHDLAKGLKLKHVFKNEHLPFSSRVNIKRILNQANILENPFTKYKVIRNVKNLKSELKEIWNTFHTPIIIKSNNIFSNRKSLLTYSFSEAEKEILNILNNKEEALIEEHISGNYISLAILPRYRGEELYIPIPIQIINKNKKERMVGDKKIVEKYLNSHNHSKNTFLHNDKYLKDNLKKIAEKIYNILALDSHALIDFAIFESEKNIKIKILEVHTDPHLFSESRFESALSASGVSIGKFVKDTIVLIEEDFLVY